MCTPEAVLAPILGKVAEILFKPVKRHVGYLFQYKNNVKNLEAEMEGLGKQREQIEEKVGQAKTDGEDIEVDVLNWLTEADKKEKDAEEFKKSKEAKENRLCFKFSCPDFIWRYQLSKQAKEKTSAVRALIEKTNFRKIGHPKPRPLERQAKSFKAYETSDSRASVFKDIMEALKNPNVKKIGIYGTGGVGKTTMVKEVRDEVQKDGLFDQVVMVVVSQSVNVYQIQEQLAKDLSFREKMDATTEDGRADQLWNRLTNGKKNLVILDDLWEEVELKTIGIPITDGTNGCKVVLTSRNRGVCQSMKVDQDFEIQMLSKLEAWELFKKKVGNSFDPPKMESVAKEVCDECGGLPVAILAVGVVLNVKRMYEYEYEWNNALEQLRTSNLKSIAGVEKKVYSSLKLSYDFIEPREAKSWFLLCSLFPEDAQIPIDELVRYGIGMGWLENEDTLEKARNKVLSLANTLKASCLLLNGENEEFVKMHDVIRDVAIEIARDEKALLVIQGFKKWLKQGMLKCYPAISLRFENVDGELPDDLKCPQLQTLRLEHSNRHGQLEVPDRFFSGMKKLRVLHLYGTYMKPIPSSLADLVDLQVLSLRSCKLANIAILKHLKKNLEILSLHGSDIEELPPEIGQLTLLRVLDLRDCNKLTVIPPGVISNLQCLEELFIPRRFNNWEVTTANEERTNAGLGELKSLTRLTTLHIHIPDVMLLPKGLCFEKLTRFAISVGRDTFDYDEISSSTTRILKLDGIPIRDDFNTLLERAEKLGLARVKDLKVLYDKVGEGLFTLKCLKVSNCGDLKYLFSPSCARGLQKLERLEIKSCEAMEGIVGLEGERDEEEITREVHFSQLKYMRLCFLPNLISFYPKIEKTTAIEEENSSIHAQPLLNEKVAFPALEEFYIERVPNITGIWDKKVESYQLKVMEVGLCEKLENVILSLTCSIVHNLKEKEAVSGDTITFPQLKTLRLLYLENLESFCNSFGSSEGQPLFNNQVAFPALDELKIECLPNITKIWNEKLLPADSFCQLRNAEVTECHKLENLALSIMLPSLQNLEEVDVSDCPNMKVIVMLEKAKEKDATGDDLITFSQLRTLRLYSLENFKYFYDNFRRSEGQSLFDHQVAFPKLEQVSLNEINLLHILADHICKLRILLIEGSDNGTSVLSPNLLHIFGHLEKLTVIKCCSVKEIFDLEGLKVEGGDVDHEPLSKLRLLDLQQLPELTCLWNKSPYGILSFQSLEVVKIMKCDILRNLFSSSVALALQQLQYLLVKSCELVEEIIADERGDEPVADIAFPQLKYLGLINLPNLKSFCSANYAFSMPSLKVVGLEGCFKMQTFALGQLSMPKTKICESFPNRKWIWSMDLNKYVRRRQISRKKGSDIDDNDEEEKVKEIYYDDLHNGNLEFDYHMDFGSWDDF